MKDQSLKYREEICIRKQYFNGPIYCLLLIALLIITATASVPLSEGTFDMQEWLDDVEETIVTIAVCMFPFVILSVLNRFCFGRIVCVVSDQGVHYQGEIIVWDDIVSMRYSSTHIGRTRFDPAYMEVVCKDREFRIVSAPMYMFSVVKKFAPQVKLKPDISIPIIIVVAIVLFFLQSYV